ncbi:aminotransferase class III-fold pyridoxal phosphate-dependent enzyme [Chloroflexota bacterium]
MEALNRKLTKSNEYWNRAEKVVAAGTQTFSKGPYQHVKGIYPIYLRSGRGSHVFDVDGNEYIDYACALGPILLGYAYPAVDEAIRKQLEEGITFSLMHPLEVELAELITEVIPCAEMVKFVKNGSDATTAAIRIARAYTGRDKIADCGYHGWHDWHIVNTTRNRGIPRILSEYDLLFKYNQIGTLERLFEEHSGEIAGVIMEPIGIEEPKDGFLEKIKELTHRNGAILIFDEIKTGLRFGLGGAQEYFGVVPDLSCFGKAIANGMPLSLLVGRKELMKECEEVFISMTFGGETLSLAAALATVKEIKEKNVIRHLWETGKQLKDGYNKLAHQSGIDTEVAGLPPMTVQIFRDMGSNSSLEMKTLFLQETVKRDILFGNGQFTTYSHTTEDITKTLEACEDTFVIMNNALKENRVKAYLEGELVQEVFRKP